MLKYVENKETHDIKLTEDSRDAILKTYTASGISLVMTGIACPIQSYLFRSEFHAYITK